VTPVPILGGGVDSRQYRISFAIETLSQVPADLVLPSGLGAFDAGVFLPRAEADWLGRRRYPPRILLVSGHEAWVVTHPAAGEQPVRLPLDRIERVEWGRILLTGWIVLTWDCGQVKLQYNTRARAPVEKCIRTIEDRWLPAAPTGAKLSAEVFGRPLDLKFKYAWSAEQLAGESPLAQFFQPAVQGNTSSAGDLVLVTSRRLLWITERREGKYERYGTVCHSARVSSIEGVRCLWTKRRGDLEIAFRSGDQWHVSLREDQEQEAHRFETLVGRTLLVGVGLPGPAAGS
jgi:hypothetical protein